MLNFVAEKKWTAWLWLSALVIVLDQITKQAIEKHFAFGESLTITSFFNLVLAYNQGAAFSFLADAGGWQKWFFIFISVAASVLITYLLRKHAQEKWFCLALALILGGALGNLIDRILYGHVIDFVQVHGAGYYFPAFNVADSAISIGAALLILHSFKNPA
ncbi:MAG: signal peptidase II [Burkholderiales bacterium]